jgi:Protein of unknown function (DUF642)
MALSTEAAMFFHRARALVAVCAALTLGPLSHAADNLLVNGSFEQPSGCTPNCLLAGGSDYIAGWTTWLSGVEYVDPLDFGTGIAPDGQMAVDLANFTYPQGGGIAQSFDTAVGGRYTLSFHAGNARFDGRTGTGWVRVQVAGVDVVVETPQASTLEGVWQRIEIGFVATSDRSELRFSNTQDPLLHYALIDDVRVTAIPEAPARWLALSGLALLLLRRLGRRA